MTTDFRGKPPEERVRSGRVEFRELGRELGDVVVEFRRLAQLEVQHAKAEVMDQVMTLARSLAFVAAAIFMSFMTVAFLMAALMFGLGLFMSLWLSALITAGVAFAILVAVASVAMRGFKSLDFSMKRTIRSIQEDFRWLQEQIKSKGR